MQYYFAATKPYRCAHRCFTIPWYNYTYTNLIYLTQIGLKGRKKKEEESLCRSATVLPLPDISIEQVLSEKLKVFPQWHAYNSHISKITRKNISTVR